VARVRTPDGLRIDPATEDDVPLVLTLIKALADYEKLAQSVVATEDTVRQTLFGPSASASAIIARVGGDAVGFAVWFHNYSTFLSRPGLYLEDLFVRPEWRGLGIGRALLSRLAQIAVAGGCGRMEWSVLDWNETAIRFYEGLGATVLNDWRICRMTGDAIKKLASGE